MILTPIVTVFRVHSTEREVVHRPRNLAALKIYVRPDFGLRPSLGSLRKFRVLEIPRPRQLVLALDERHRADRRGPVVIRHLGYVVFAVVDSNPPVVQAPPPLLALPRKLLDRQQDLVLEPVREHLDSLRRQSRAALGRDAPLLHLLLEGQRHLVQVIFGEHSDAHAFRLFRATRHLTCRRSRRNWFLPSTPACRTRNSRSSFLPSRPPISVRRSRSSRAAAF